MLKARPSALVSSRTAVDLPCEIETIRPSHSSCCRVRMSMVIVLRLRTVSAGSRAIIRLGGGERETGGRRRHAVPNVRLQVRGTLSSSDGYTIHLRNGSMRRMYAGVKRPTLCTYTPK